MSSRAAADRGLLNSPRRHPLNRSKSPHQSSRDQIVVACDRQRPCATLRPSRSVSSFAYAT
jgi:hypothetical protein